MKTLLLALALTLTGCATLERHPRITAFVATSIALSAVAMHHGKDRAPAIEEPRMSTPLVACHNGSCR